MAAKSKEPICYVIAPHRTEKLWISREEISSGDVRHRKAVHSGGIDLRSEGKALI